MILDEFVEVTWSGAGISRYKELGYTYTKYKDKFLVKVEHLTPGSSKLINISCDVCGTHLVRPYYRYNEVTKNGTTEYKCRTCFSSDLERVTEAFRARGYTPLFDEYRGCKEFLHYTCEKHPDVVQRTTYDMLSTGRGCRFCGKDSMKKYFLTSIDTIRAEFEKDPRGYVLLSTEYTSGKDKLDYICPNHPETPMSISLNNYRKGKGCRLCYRDNCRGELSNGYTGMATLTNCLRSYLSDWVKLNLRKHDYTCELTGVRGGALEVHHVRSFASIRNEALRITGFHRDDKRYELTPDEYDVLIGVFESIHSKHEPIVVTKDIHRLFHKMYGVVNFSESDFYEFERDFKNGYIVFS